jgi:hypothetical protein
MRDVRDLPAFDILNLITRHLLELLTRLPQLDRCVSIVMLGLIHTKAVESTVWIRGRIVLFLDRLKGLASILTSSMLGRENDVLARVLIGVSRIMSQAVVLATF